MARHRLWVIAWKDALEFLRDRRSIGLMLVSAFLFPLLGLLVTGLKSQQQAPVVVEVCDSSKYAAELAALLLEALRDYVSFNVSIVNLSACRPVPGAAATIAIPPSFGANLSSLGGTAVIKIYEAIGNPAAVDAVGVAESVMQTYSEKMAEARVRILAEKAGIDINPDTVLHPLKIVREGVTPQGRPASPEEAQRASVARFLAFSVFFVLNPAALAVADAVSRERESGTGELLAITPLTGFEFVSGKALGSLTAALVAGGVDFLAAFAYAAATGFHVADMGLVALHAIETVLAVLVTMAVTILLTLLVPGQRAATLVTSLITGTAIMVFFAVLFVDVAALPLSVKTLLYLVPYTHTALAIEAYALGNLETTLIHTALLAVVTIASLIIAAAAYRPERLVKRH